MSDNQRWRRSAAVAAVLVTLSAGSARAVAPIYHLDLESSPMFPGWGTGVVYGDLEFTGKFKFHYELFVSDQCPADGVGTSFMFESVVGDGDWIMSQTRGYDTNGCGNGYVPWESTLQTQRMIGKTRVVQCYTNDGNLCWIQSLRTTSWKDNPTW